MHLLRWQNEYLVGNETIDADHKHLFDIINEFYDAFARDRKRSDLTVILVRLVEYAEAHFQREEKIMQEYGYPESAEHHKVHEELYETIYKLKERLEHDPSPIDRDAVGFLKHWLVDHILAQDLPLGTFIRAAKEKTGAAAEPAKVA